jgi:hypothetical protein
VAELAQFAKRAAAPRNHPVRLTKIQTDLHEVGSSFISEPSHLPIALYTTRISTNCSAAHVRYWDE